MNKFDSFEELYASWYFEELKKNGYIESWSKNETPIVLTEPLLHQYVVPMKRVADKAKYQKIMNGSEYTYDFDVVFTKKAFGIFVSHVNLNHFNKVDCAFKNTFPYDRVTRVEIKGGFDQNNMTRLAVNNIKFLYQSKRIYVNLIKIPDLFKKTFTPKRYLLTDKSMQPRKIKFPVVTLEEFVAKKSKGK